MKRLHLPHPHLPHFSLPHLRLPHSCPITGENTPPSERIPIAAIQKSVIELLIKDHPECEHTKWISKAVVDEYNRRHVEEFLHADRGELSELDHEVMQAIHDQEILTTNIDVEYEEDMSLGARAADTVATFGGSWMFVISFTAFIIFWMGINTYWFFHVANFDPYPFILLNLVLSCLAALQAPIIMMSQNRQAAKDRIRDETEYKVSLKSELEIRNLSAKMDAHMQSQWAQLIEMQEAQMELLEKLKQDKETPQDQERT